jgi:hypothetical protein
VLQVRHAVIPRRAASFAIACCAASARWVPRGVVHWPFLHKRKSFEHEQEVRALIYDFDEMVRVWNGNERRASRNEEHEALEYAFLLTLRH